MRCLILGHKWGAWIDGHWYAPRPNTPHLLTYLECKRCGISRRSVRRANRA
jgi:hypothetical protein